LRYRTFRLDIFVTAAHGLKLIDCITSFHFIKMVELLVPMLAKTVHDGT